MTRPSTEPATQALTRSAEDAREAAPLMRRRTLSVRLTEAEHAEITAAVARTGRRQLGAWGRRVMLEAARGKGTTPAAAVTDDGSPAVVELRQAVRELVAIGRNLNQAVRALNTPGADGDGAWIAWLERHADAVEEHTDAVRAAAQAVRDEVESAGE